HVFQGSLAAVAPSNWDIVVVNILAPVIVELLTAGRLMEFVAASSWLILSGIITDQQAQVVAAVAAAGGRVERALTADDWVTLLARKIETP
ncbi:MAG: 50S ribosomal protein L11 methyltransferase, partial [Candidatus Promineifilaceae bacterium]